MARVRFVFALLALGAAFSLAIPQGLQNQRVNYRVYRSGGYSRIKDYRVIEIHTEGKWQKYWMESTGNPANTAPKDVNFGAEMLIAVHLGQRNTGGYTVQVQDIRRSQPDVMQVSILEYTPSPDMMVTQAITSPYVIIRLSKQAGRFVFSKQTEYTPRPFGGMITRPNRECDCDCACCRAGKCKH